MGLFKSDSSCNNQQKSTSSKVEVGEAYMAVGNPSWTLSSLESLNELCTVRHSIANRFLKFRGAVGDGALAQFGPDALF